VEFLSNIRNIAASPVVRLSKKQRDKADEVLAEAFSDYPFVFLEGEALADLAGLIRHARADGRVSSLGENVMLTLTRRLDDLAMADSGEPAIAVSGKQWRIIEEIRQKTRFGLPGEPPPIDPDGVVENEDPDCLPPERDEHEIERAQDWLIVGVDVDEDL
jgi:hypothetical protein